jgi:CDGSH-type Zn-finger protein
MPEPKIADTKPMGVEVEEGETYYWCACGNSSNQPFCDGSHRGTGMGPKPYTAEESGTVYMCMCKHSGNDALCDGSHKNYK